MKEIFQKYNQLLLQKIMEKDPGSVIDPRDEVFQKPIKKTP